ncbi:hypothetical protein [Pseudomonas fluorescens]|uniref:Uncharacterized protein n=1 Tax=Pseudomonas fluorescens TaxID=294 RepID=A0A5E7QFL4_PSEFL|nr:hypothetical protein [Pseudomonas fluorescens]VVP59647.1 hypothetical protein PS880_06053 [Pseudomonas fluorescens]
MSMASWLEESFDLVAVRTRYEAIPDDDKVKFEVSNAEIIQELIAETEGQRPAYLRQVAKNVDSITQGILIVFAIIGQVRVMEMIELRDRFRYSLSPGGPNRATCAGIYAFHQEIISVTLFDWPDEVFDAFGSDGGWPDDEDLDDE